MEKNILIKCINDNMSIGDISKKYNISKTTIIYWLKKFNLKTKYKSFKEIGIIDYNESKYCPRCNTKKQCYCVLIVIEKFIIK